MNLMQTLQRKMAICRRLARYEQSRTAKPSQGRSRGFLKLLGFQQLLHCLLNACVQIMRPLAYTLAPTALQQHQGAACDACLLGKEIPTDSRRSLLWISSSAIGSVDTARRLSCCRDMTRTAMPPLALSRSRHLQDQSQNGHELHTVRLHRVCTSAPAPAWSRRPFASRMFF